MRRAFAESAEGGLRSRRSSNLTIARLKTAPPGGQPANARSARVTIDRLARNVEPAPQLVSPRTFTPVTLKCFAACSMWRSFV